MVRIDIDLLLFLERLIRSVIVVIIGICIFMFFYSLNIKLVILFMI